MTSIHQNEEMNLKNFREYCIQWREEQITQLQELITASHPPLKDSSYMWSLVNRVISHYQQFYTFKSKCVLQNNDDVLPILSSSWYTPLEDAYCWTGGWRPTTAIHLLYSKCGLQLEAKLTEMVNDANMSINLADLSSGQLVLIDNLQRSTIREERAITEEMAKNQETVADAEIVELSHEMSQSNRGSDDERVDSALKPKKERIQKIMESADDLRMKTLKGVIDIVSPIQAIHFLIAATELQLRVHDWGREEEEKKDESDVV